MRNIIKNTFLFFSISILFVACYNQPFLSIEKNIDNKWHYDTPLVFDLDIEDIEAYYDLLLKLDYSSSFSYQNIYVKIATEYPDGSTIEDMISLNLTDGRGQFLGNCNNEHCETDILLQERFRFKNAGMHKIALYQNGREEDLDGIFSATLKLFKIQQ